MIKNILFDFDGVILDSMPTREFGFVKIFEEFNETDVKKLLDYHNANGGFSRFVKIKYFFEEILKQTITKEQIQAYADNFSKIMKEELVKRKYLINQTVEFIEQNHKKYNLHIVSGSEHNELNYLCEQLELKDYFLDINGSPTPKKELVKNLLEKENYNKDETILIGDSINDYDAAKINGINFYGYNNPELKEVSFKYLDDYSEMNKD